MKLIEILTQLQTEISDQFNELSDFNGAGEIEIKHGRRTVLYFDFFINEEIELTTCSCNQMMMVDGGWVEDATADDDLITIMEKSLYLLLKERYELLEEKIEADKKEQEKIIPTGDEVAQENGFTDLASSYKQ